MHQSLSLPALLVALTLPASAATTLVKLDFGTAALATGYTQYSAADTSVTSNGITIALTSSATVGNGSKASSTLSPGDLYRDYVATPFNGASGATIDLTLTGFTEDGTLDFTVFLDYNNSLALPQSLRFKESTAASFTTITTAANRPGSYGPSTPFDVESGKSYIIRLQENGNANLAYISGLDLSYDPIPEPSTALLGGLGLLALLRRRRF
ncbi:MAG: PEP-CTERM sorting domain-containing protein [Akkermansiaceae bacterium]